jgi:hypothetical protein
MGEYFGLHRLDIGSLYSRQTPCRLLWTQMHVLYDGSVSGCCRDYNGELIAGDVRKAPILEIWKSAEYSRLREKHLSGNLDDLPLCRDCYGVDKELTMIFNDYLLCLFSAFKDRQPDFYMERIYSFLRVLARLKEDGSGKGRRGIIKDLSKEMK